MISEPILELPDQAKSNSISEVYGRLIDQSPSALVLVKSNGDICLVNEAGAAMFGYSKDEMLGMPVEQLVPPDQRSSHVHHRHSYATGPQLRAMVHDIKREILGFHKDGSCFPVEIKLNSLSFEGELLTISTILDLTERWRYEEAIKRSNHDLEQFGHAVAHDLRAPISQLSMYAQILEDDYKALLDEDGRKVIEGIKRGASRSAALIDGLLGFASLKQTGQPSGPVPLRATLDQALANLAMDIQESNANLTIAELPTVVGIDIQLTRLFQNLIANALKFCKPDRVPTIAIDAISRADGMVEVRIKDNGIGVANEYQDLIFKMLERLHPSSKYEGTGIGLASCRQIVEIHGGKIGIESEEGEGSVFWFTLPLAT